MGLLGFGGNDEDQLWYQMLRFIHYGKSSCKAVDFSSVVLSLLHNIARYIPSLF